MLRSVWLIWGFSTGSHHCATVSAMIKGEVSEPFRRSTDNPSLPSLSFSRVTVSIEVLTPGAHKCLKELLDAANAFGEKPVEYPVIGQNEPVATLGAPGWDALQAEQSQDADTGGKGWLK